MKSILAKFMHSPQKEEAFVKMATIPALSLAVRERLMKAAQALAQTQTLDDVTAIVRVAARDLVGADGATFVLREDDKCYYADEDAISPLWKGQRFPLDECVSGWVITRSDQVAIRDIYYDARVPIEAYRPTFVKSMAMVPIRQHKPLGAIGTYWASHHQTSPDEMKVLQALADITAAALENVLPQAKPSEA